jgi:hypothetical protein
MGVIMNEDPDIVVQKNRLYLGMLLNNIPIGESA